MRGVSANPKTFLLILYVFMFFMLFMEVPKNEYTLPKIIVLSGIFVGGLALLLGWQFIIPNLFKSWRLGSCTVRNSKYIICERKTGSELVGKAALLLIPQQPLADVPKEAREGLLQTLQGILAGSQFETTVAYITVRDRYHQNIIRWLEDRRNRLLTFSFSGKETPATRETLKRIERELNILKQVPVILEGFYVAIVTDYGPDEYTLMQKLEADLRALSARLSSAGLLTKELTGERLRAIMDYMTYGGVAQISL